MNSHLKAIGKVWLEEKNNAQLNAKQEEILGWLAGGLYPFTAQESLALGAVENELVALRKALNDGLRSSLALKIGLSTQYDPIRQAIGVPAQQGLTSATTKFSDPLMQLCLANMIAVYTPQGEEFLLSAAGDVQEKLTQKGKVDPVAAAASEQLKVLLQRRKEEPGLKLSEELAGPEPWKVLVRGEFANQTAAQQLIYLSQGQISRPVQNTVRGCNVIATTGTPTRNLTQVIGSNGNTHGMEGVAATGRSITAEVIYRIAKGSPQGLDTPVKTYSMQKEKAFEELQSFATKGSGYNFLINQAGLCDHKTQRETVEALTPLATAPSSFLISFLIKSAFSLTTELSPSINSARKKKAAFEKKGSTTPLHTHGEPTSISLQAPKAP